MSNRLQLFRQRMSAFEGTVDPLKAIESGYYVRAPGKLLADIISARIALRPSSSHLLIGGIGTGKTTQLVVASQEIQKVEDTYAHYVDVSLYTDIFKISIGVLTAIAGLVIAELVKDTTDEEINKHIKLIHDLAFGYSEFQYQETFPTSLLPHLDTQFGLKRKVEVKRKGIIPAKQTNHGVQKELVQALTKLVATAAKMYGNIVILFDGLDRLDDAQTFLQIISTDLKAISDCGIGVVLVGPLVAIYGDYRDTVGLLDYFYYQPCFDVANDPEAHSFFAKILEIRSSEDFIEKSALEGLIHYSGGVIRDLVSLAQASIEETYLSGEERLLKKHVEAAAESFGRAQLLGLSDNELEIIKEISKKGTFIPRTAEDIRLIVTRRILEYRYPKFHHAVHPAIQPLIQHL